MSYDKLFKVLDGEDKLKSLVTNLSSGYIDTPYIIKETLKILEDDSIHFNRVSDSNKRSLCIMMDNYFNDCWEQYINDINLDKLLEYGKIEIYKINANNGIRYATTGEVASGVKGLIGEYIYPAGEQEYKNLCLLHWTFTGISYYYRQAGFKLDYDKSGNVMTHFYEMITQSAVSIKEMFDWVSKHKDVDAAISKIKKIKNKHGYKYATYATDEVTDDLSIKQLVYNIYNVFPRNSSNHEYRKALSLAIKSYVNKKKLTPLEVSKLREIYEKYAVDMDRNRQLAVESNKELKKKCEELLTERYSGKLNHNHFAYTIISTLKKNNYSRCTDKQMTIIDSAYSLIRTSNKTNENTNSEVITDTDIDLSLSSMYDDLFDDEEEND